MAVKDIRTVNTYAANHAKMLAAIENLREFIESMPAPDEDGNIPNVDYGYTGSAEEMAKHLAEACRIADAMSK